MNFLIKFHSFFVSEETIVKVESSLLDIKPSLCSTEISNEIIRDISDMSNLSSSSNNILQQPKYFIDV
jgi:hypothetical protein